MISVIIKNSLLWVLLIFLQVSIFNFVEIHPAVSINQYTFLVIILPLSVSRYFALVLAFLTGLTIDMFLNTPGLHAAALTSMAYFKYFILKFMISSAGYDDDPQDAFKSFGFLKFTAYAALMLLVFHFVLFSLEWFRFSALPFILLKTFLSTLLTLIVVILYRFSRSSERYKR